MLYDKNEKNRELDVLVQCSRWTQYTEHGSNTIVGYRSEEHRRTKVWRTKQRQSWKYVLELSPLLISHYALNKQLRIVPDVYAELKYSSFIPSRYMDYSLPNRNNTDPRRGSWWCGGVGVRVTSIANKKGSNRFIP